MFSMVISVISEVISVDFGDFGESCYQKTVIREFASRIVLFFLVKQYYGPVISHPGPAKYEANMHWSYSRSSHIFFVKCHRLHRQ